MHEVLVKFLDKIPLRFRKGPWHIMAHIYLVWFFGFLCLSAPYAFETYKIEHFDAPSEFLLNYRFYGSFYCIFIIIFLYIRVGWYPFVSYTITSWNLMTLRLILSNFESVSETMAISSRLLRFPALAGNTVTFFIWWGTLFPLIYYVSDAHRRQEFLAFNFSFLLVNIHMLNLPLCAIEFLATNHHFVFFDLWVGFVVAFIYMLFYLNVLDPLGVHLYIILTPRTVYCVLPYTLVVFVYLGCYYGWNTILPYFHI